MHLFPRLPPQKYARRRLPRPPEIVPLLAPHRFRLSLGSLSPQHAPLLPPVQLLNSYLSPHLVAGMQPAQVPVTGYSPIPLLAPVQLQYAAPAQIPRMTPQDVPNSPRAPPVPLWGYGE